MAEYKAVNAEQLDADLTAVADAIRGTNATNEEMAFPDSFVANIDKANQNILEYIERKNYYRFFFPKGITKIGRAAFNDCQTLIFPKDVPEGIVDINYYAFHNCFEIHKVNLPTSLKTLGGQSFDNCISLTEVTFKGMTTKVANNAFSSCAKLTTINVPWAEGEVSGAPWGATNATINYNYVAEG